MERLTSKFQTLAHHSLVNKLPRSLKISKMSGGLFTVFKSLTRKFATPFADDLVKALEASFEAQFKKVNIISCEDGKCMSEMTVDFEHTNLIGTMHGGYSASLVDTMTSLALYSHPKNKGLPSVSITLNVNYLKAAKLGDEISIDSQIVKLGKSMAYLKCIIKNKETDEILVTGTHTKYILFNES